MHNRPTDEILLHLLVCPVCHAALTSPDRDTILCTGCGRHYPIRDGLPVLLSDAARQ
ncbi:MAG TPA: Trm112 family protein [Acidobacteriaceae bacterium]